MTGDAISLNDMAGFRSGRTAFTDRQWNLALFIVGALALAIGVAVVDRRPVGVFHDDAMYVILAKSLATGQGYRYLNIPGMPVATHFPPGYPALLAVVWRVAPDFPANLVVFKAMNAAFFCACAVLVTVLARDRLRSARWAIVVGLLSAVSVPLLVLVTMVLSEPLFLAVLLAVLVCAERFVDGEPSPRTALIVGALIGVLTLVRTHGIVLLPAVVVPLVTRRRMREAASVTVLALAMLLPWQLWSAAHAGVLPAPLEGNYGSYVGWWVRGFRAMGPAMIPATLQRTIPELSSMLAALFAPARASGGHAITLAVLAALALRSTISLRHRAPVTLLFLGGYSAIALLWPFPPSRFFWGVWPLVLFLLMVPAVGLTRALSRGPTPVRALTLAMLLWVAAGYTMYEVRAVRGAWWSSISRTAADRIEPAIAWTRTHTASGDVVASDDEGSIYLYTRRHSVPVASFTTSHYLGTRSAQREAAEGLVPLLATYPIRAVLVGSSRTFDAASFLASRPAPKLSLHDQFAGGAAFTVLSR